VSRKGGKPPGGTEGLDAVLVRGKKSGCGGRDTFQKEADLTGCAHSVARGTRGWGGKSSQQNGDKGITKKKAPRWVVARAFFLRSNKGKFSPAPMGSIGARDNPDWTMCVVRQRVDRYGRKTGKAGLHF